MGPCGAAARAKRARAEARAARARTGGRTRAARAHGAFGAARAEGPKGQGGHWDFSEGWPNGRVSKEEARFEIVFSLLLLCLKREFASEKSLPLGCNALFVLLWREFASGDHLGASGV